MPSNHQYSLQQWTVFLQEYAVSDLTPAQFCKSIDVSQSTFYKWKRRLQGREDSQGNPPASPTFVPVSIAVTELSEPLKIELPNRATISVNNDVDSLRPVLQVLLELTPKENQ